MIWRILAIIAAIMAAFLLASGPREIYGYQWPVSTDTGTDTIIFLNHMNENIFWLFMLIGLSAAAIFCALMDIGDSVRKRG